MNTKSKSKKGKEKGIIGIALAAIMIASIFAVIAPSTTADVKPLGEIHLMKTTINCTTGEEEPLAQYALGDKVCYWMRIIYPGATNWTGNTHDDYPNNITEQLDTGLFLNAGVNKSYYRNYTVAAADVTGGYMLNTFRVSGKDGLGDDCSGSVEKNNTVLGPEKEPPEFNFTWDRACCRNISFVGWSSDPTNVTNHTWNFGDGSPTEWYSGAPGTVTHQYAACNPPFGYTVTLSGYCTQGLYNSTWDLVWPDCDPTVIVSATPTCFEGTGELITFDGSNSYADTTANLSNTITWWNWTFSDNVSGSNDDTAVTSRVVNDTVTATLEVSDGHCNNTKTVTVGPCSLCNIRLYGTYGRGAGDFTVNDPYTGLAPENKPYTDPVAPFFPQHPQAPRKDFITFNPAIMAHNNAPPYEDLDFVECGGGVVQSPAEKVFKRMWYEKEWFKDYVNNGEWDVVMVDDITTMTLSEWFAIDQWERPTIREWNSPDAPDWNSNADIYGPAIVQEFTYMTLDQDWYPIMVQNGSELLIPMAHDPSNPSRGLNSFDADGDGDWDFVRVESEQTLGIDIDQDSFEEPMDGDLDELSGNETVVFVLGPKTVYRPGYGSTTSLQFFDHVVTVDTVDQVDGDYKVWLHVLDNEGDGSLRDSYAALKEDEIAYFYRAKAGRNGERPAFYVKLLSADYDGQYAKIEVGRMFGQTYANIEANQYRSQKMFIVDEVFYNVVAIKAQDNCFKYITFRQKLPKTPIKIFGKHLKVWTTDEVLPEMSPYNLEHEILPDINPIVPEDPPYPIVKIPPEAAKVQMPPLEIIYVDETEELRYKGELKEIYTEEHDSPIDEFWTLEWYWTLPWQYTEFQLPAGDKYLVTLSWIAPEAETTLWDDIPDEPVWYKTRDRFKFWYEDCSGPLYIDRAASSIRLYGTFGEGAGDQGATDVEPGASYDMEPENKPYTDPEGPFFPQHEQAPVKDFMTFNPAIMDHNQGYPELDFIECPGYIVQTPKEKVFKRMWYEKEWFKDYDGADTNGEWDVVIEQYDDLVDMKWEFYDVMTLSSWNAMPDYVKIRDMLRIREYNSPNSILGDWEPRADIYGPAIVQEFTYMTVNQDTMPIMVQAGSEILIPLAHNASDPYRGLNSFDADADGVRDAVRVESERTLALKWGTQGPPPQPEDIDDDGTVEWMDADSTELNGNEQVVFVLGPKILDQATELQFFDHVVELVDISVAGGSYWVSFKVSDNEKGGYTRHEDCTPMQVGDVQHFYRGKYPAGGEKPAFYLKLLSADYNSQTVRIEVGRMFGQTHANIEFNQYRAQKMFIVDEVFYNVVAVKTDDNCFKYITIRQKLPKEPIKIFGKHLKVWDEGETLPEMTPFNMDHEILVDVQPGWGAIPHSQQAKIGHKVPVVPLNITYVDEDKEWRFLGELKEIYNETDEPWPRKEEYWNVEWFHTQPMQYTAFVMPEGQGLYLMTLAWYAPEAEITIWDHNPDGPYDDYTYERVKFWYDPADNTDIYINRVGDIPEEEITIVDWYNMASYGGDGIPWISSDEVINAVMDYLTADTDPTPEDNPFTPGSDPYFTKDDLLNYILAYLAQ